MGQAAGQLRGMGTIVYIVPPTSMGGLRMCSTKGALWTIAQANGLGVGQTKNR